MDRVPSRGDGLRFRACPSAAASTRHRRTAAVTLFAFAAAVGALLVTPGPTNTLLATAGATVGFRRAAPLLLGELCGYLVSVSTLLLVLGPVVAARPALALALRGASAVCLLFIAWRLWRAPARASSARASISVRHVFVTTLLNPKGLVFAFAIFPPPTTGAAIALLPWLGVFSLLISTIGAAWIAVGSAVGTRLPRAVASGLVRRVGASVVAVFGVLWAASVAYGWVRSMYPS